MEYLNWSLLLLIVKITSYVAIAALAGGFLINLLLKSAKDTNAVEAYLRPIKKWQLVFLIAGLLAAMAHIPIEAASLADTGWQGLFDTLMLNIVWQSVIGDQAILRITGLSLGILTIIFWQKPYQSRNPLNLIVTIAALIIMAISFSVAGHSASDGLWVHAILSLHVIAISLWIGSLWPLYKSCRKLSAKTVKNLMEDFGRVALYVVLLLIICGVILLFRFVDTLTELFTTGYGQLIILKLLLVSSMLLLAAWHKLVLVPKLIQQHNIKSLQKSIAIETIIGVLVIVVTSIFTTIVGPS